VGIPAAGSSVVSRTVVEGRLTVLLDDLPNTGFHFVVLFTAAFFFIAVFGGLPTGPAGLSHASSLQCAQRFGRPSLRLTHA
jgi:hypothetical protein